MSQSADYVVVGAGSAGAIVARRLADSGASVILVESGRRNRSSLVRTPGLVGPMHTVARIQRRVTWQRESVRQPHALGRRFPQIHGRVLGGTSAVNGMAFVRGHRQNFDDWAADGATGWTHADVLPYFRRLETFEDGPSHCRGGSGPIQVTRVRDRAPATEGFLGALSSVTGVQRNDDYNGAEQEGPAIVQQSVLRGQRQSTAACYLDDAPSNLQSTTGRTVQRVLVQQGRAIGVEVRTRSGIEQIYAHREVVLSAGTFASAQLLMLSGIGPAAHLSSLGIDVVSDLPVGDNLQDHVFMPQAFSVTTGRLVTPGRFARTLIRERVSPDSTWLAQTPFEGVAFVRSPHAGAVPDVQLFAMPFSRQAPHEAPFPAMTILSILMYPRSRGTVRLASTDPDVAPLIDPNYFAEPNDVELLVSAMSLVREAMADASLAKVVRGELEPSRSRTGAAALAHDVRERAAVIFHPVGTCRIGTDERAVIDPQLRVIGVDGLRVADASVMPTITGGNTNAPAMMIGERAADLILHSGSAS